MNDTSLDRATVALERIALVLAAMYAQRLTDKDQGAKAAKLSHLGFSNVQIADALGTTGNAIGVALHKARKGSSSGTKSKASKKKGKK
jgi:hypothetical protein